MKSSRNSPPLLWYCTDLKTTTHTKFDPKGDTRSVQMYMPNDLGVTEEIQYATSPPPITFESNIFGEITPKKAVLVPGGKKRTYLHKCVEFFFQRR